MNALKLSWADDDVTQTVDPLGRSGAGPIAQLDGATTITTKMGMSRTSVLPVLWDGAAGAGPLGAVS